MRDRHGGISTLMRTEEVLKTFARQQLHYFKEREVKRDIKGEKAVSNSITAILWIALHSKYRYSTYMNISCSI